MAAFRSFAFLGALQSLLVLRQRAMCTYDDLTSPDGVLNPNDNNSSDQSKSEGIVL
jgi:hypothetical protein